MAQTCFDGISYLGLVIVSLKTSSFSYWVSSFAVFALEHIACSLVFFSVLWADKLKQVRIADSAAQLTASARWGLLNMGMDDPISEASCWALLACFILSALWCLPITLFAAVRFSRVSSWIVFLCRWQQLESHWVGQSCWGTDMGKSEWNSPILMTLMECHGYSRIRLEWKSLSSVFHLLDFTPCVTFR